MPDTADAAHYYQFMKWLKTQHAGLYGKYKLHIKIPVAGKLIEAAMDYVDPADKELLRNTITAFYALRNKKTI